MALNRLAAGFPKKTISGNLHIFNRHRSPTRCSLCPGLLIRCARLGLGRNSPLLSHREVHDSKAVGKRVASIQSKGTHHRPHYALASCRDPNTVRLWSGLIVINRRPPLSMKLMPRWTSICSAICLSGSCRSRDRVQQILKYGASLRWRRNNGSS